MIGNQNKELVKPYIQNYIDKLFAAKDQIGFDYFTQAWHRVCGAFGDFGDLNSYYPTLLEKTKLYL